MRRDEADEQMNLSSDQQPQPRIPEDQTERDIIRGDLDTNLMVLAGAGAGKTYELVERMVALLSEDRRQDSIHIRNIAAITFTRKAAGELRTRFYDRLLKEAQGPESDSTGRLQAAAGRIDQCFIGTIHSFCSRLLRERPLEAGLPFDFKELDERDEPRTRRRVWTQFTNERLRAGDSRFERLLENGFNAEELYSFFSRRIEFPELELKPTTADEPDLEHAVDSAWALVQRSEPLLTASGRTKPGPWGQAAIKAKHFRSKRELITTAERSEFLLLFDSAALLDKGVAVTKYSDKEFAYELRDVLVPALKRDVVDPALRNWKQYVFSLMAGLVDEAAAYYTEKRRQTGTVTFSDLLIKTAALLRDHPDVRRYFQKRYKRVLVDEFQDTDPVQAEILFYLTGEDVDERDWRSLEPYPGSMFVVGDEKQSIYRFRRADVDTFRFVRDRIRDTGGRIVELNTSFRSLGNLCGWLNDTFGRVFGDEDKRYQSDYGHLLRYREDGDNRGCVRKLVLPDQPGGRPAIVAAEANRIADFIAAARIGKTEFNGDSEAAILPVNPSFGSFMILVWTKKFVDTYAQALEARGIAYDLVGGGDLGTSEELQVITHMLEAVADPKDPSPLLGYLRGLLVGMADTDLLEIRKTVRRFDYMMDDFGALDDLTSERLREAYGRLRRIRHLLEEQTPAAAMEQIVSESGLIPWTSASTDFMGSSRAGNLNRLLANVRRWERQGLHWVEIVHEMRALIHDADYKIPGLTLESGQADAVRIMNLHQAKGLEADVVFLADPTGSGYSGPPNFHVSRLGAEPYLSMTVQSQTGWSHKTLAEPEGWEEDEVQETRYLGAETTRLRYVAATRARNLLVVSIAEGKKKGPWMALNNYLTSEPEFELYPRASAPARVDRPTEYAAYDEAHASAWKRIAEPSWSVETASTEKDDHFLSLSGERRGADFGTVVHQMLDDLIRGNAPDIEAYLNTSTALDSASKMAAVAAAAGFMSSPIWSEIGRSDRVFTEASFGGRSSEDPEVLTRGRIDLVYRLEDGWKIVDYKTDAAATEQEALHLVDHYREQVTAYAAYWSRITNEPVNEKGLWLTELNRFIPVD